MSDADDDDDDAEKRLDCRGLHELCFLRSKCVFWQNEMTKLLPLLLKEVRC